MTRNDHPSHLDPLDLLTMTQCVEITKRARSSLYQDIKNGELQVVHLGRSVRIPRVELERYIAERAATLATVHTIR